MQVLPEAVSIVKQARMEFASPTCVLEDLWQVTWIGHILFLGSSVHICYWLLIGISVTDNTFFSGLYYAQVHASSLRNFR